MPYFVIEDFKQGLDSRRMEQATNPSALVKLENGHINRGGEIEKAKAFVATYALPAGTFGLAALVSDLYVFGSGTDPGVPAGITYQQLAHEGGSPPAMTAFLNSDVFAGAIFAIAEYETGARRAFYDGTIVAGFLTGSGTAFEDLVISAACLTYKNKMYLTSGSNLLFSKSGDASIFDELQTGSGLIDLSLHVSSEADLNALAAYQDSLAVISSQNIAIWDTDPDPANYALRQVLPNIGTDTPRSALSFGDHDLFLLSNTGVRSLRAINSSLSAGVSDVGTPVDDMIIEHLDTLSAADIAAACGALEPKDGRYLIPLGDTVYVFSFFAASKISAWSTWKPGFSINDYAMAAGRLYARAGNTVYLLGGETNTEYTDQRVLVETGWLDARSLATWKQWKFLDVILSGEWSVYINTNPNDPNPADGDWERIAVINDITLGSLSIAIEDYGPLMKLRFVHQGDGRAVLSKIIIHYDKDDQTK